MAGARPHGTWGPFTLACAGSLLTSAYMLRWWFKIFHGEERDHEVTHHAHDPSGAAKVVLLVLAPLTLSLPWTAGGWLDAALGAPHGEELHHAHTTAMWVALTLLAAGGAFAFAVYGRTTAGDLAAGLAQRFAALHRACAELWGIDRLWHRLFARGVGEHGARLSAKLDLGSTQRLAALESGKPGPDDFESLDGLVDGVGRACAQLGRGGARVHSGRLGVYLAGAIVLLALGAWWGLSR
jgi:NADH:ubiquinone oxidoreductase subunit 5 (subunit L)/multisubunit Na+/H+ antiporter MnhA subunit